MSYRESGARTGANEFDRALRMLSKAVERLSDRLRRIESSNRNVPPDLRFDTDEEGDDLYLVVERVSTGNRERVTGPL